MRTHIALTVGDLEGSQRFYGALLGAEPYRTLPGYTQFLTASLNLALTAGGASGADRGHYGLEVETPEAVAEALSRVRGEGLEVRVEEDVWCCHSRQSKFWAVDPDGRRWEVFHVAERRMSAPSAEAPCCPPA